MFGPTAGSLRRTLDTERISDALERAEKASSGEIRISIAPYFWGDVRRRAEQAFVRLGMTATRQRNGVLFFVVPSRHRLVVLGDDGIHRKVGQAFWDEVVGEVTARFRQRDYTTGLLVGIDRVAARLAEHFPPLPGDVNELPDAVEFTKRDRPFRRTPDPA